MPQYAPVGSPAHSKLPNQFTTLQNVKNSHLRIGRYYRGKRIVVILRYVI